MTIEQLHSQNTLLKQVVEEQNRLFEKLDEAMATPSQIAFDKENVGGFVSSLDLTETAEEIVNRAVAALDQRKMDGKIHVLIAKWEYELGEMERKIRALHERWGASCCYIERTAELRKRIDQIVELTKN
ncbi:hypothetical protein LCGC14_1633530 [marine sediment metagenome]|uniref:Uncharacterized protein n=1 Tax=marine sediment metagenome TaxID=412755 RepID=A0A0F9KHI5_9ZZZZ